MGKVSHLRLIILSCVILFTIGETIKVDTDNASNNATADNTSNEKDDGCSAAAGSDQCSRSEGRKLSRKKRTLTLPNNSAILIQSRLFIPQLPIGFYLVWVRIRFFIRYMFTESIISQAGGNPLLAALSKKRKRSTGEEFDEEDYEKDISNILTRTLADDQLEILKKVEDGLDRGGLPGKQCVLRAICEIKETPIHEWSLVGEMITNFILPKKDNLTALDDYRRAETIGEEHGDCWSFYPACPFSIFNIIPDIYTKDDQVEVTFDDFSAGSGSSKEGPDSESDNEDNVNNKNKDADDIFENNSDETLKTLLKQFGGTADDIKNINIDLDLTKP